MAFVVIVHLHPEHESKVAELIRRKTSLTVLQVTVNVRIKPLQFFTASCRLCRVPTA